MNKYRPQFSGPSQPSLRTSKQENGSWLVTATGDKLKDKSWSGETEQQAIEKARTDLHQMGLKGDL